MSWIQENKFTATLAGVTAVGSAALLYLSMQQSGAEKDIRVKTKKLVKEETTLKGGSPFPSKENLEAKKENVADFAKAAVKLQDLMVMYRPDSIETFEPAAFGPMLSEYRTNLNGAFEAAGTTLPERTFYGFKDYSNRLPKQSATGQLKYQMEAAKWLFTALAEVGPEKLINIYREPLGVESGEVTEDKSQRKGRGRSKSEPVVVYQKKPLEISFLASEKSVLEFMEKISNSDKYFFTVKSIRLRNENQAAPSESSAKFEVRGGGSAVDDLFGSSPEGGDSGGFLVEPQAETVEPDAEAEAQPAPELIPTPSAPVSGDRILKQILGKEKVYVTMSLELIIFEPKDKVVIPRAKAESTDEAANKELK